MDNKGLKLCGHVRVVELACSVSLSGPFPAIVPQRARPLGGGGGWKEAGHGNVTQRGALREGEAGGPLVRLLVPACVCWGCGACYGLEALQMTNTQDS